MATASPPDTATRVWIVMQELVTEHDRRRALRDEGLIEMRPRRGIQVVGTPAESELLSKVADLVQFARRRGYTRADLLQMVANAS